MITITAQQSSLETYGGEGAESLRAKGRDHEMPDFGLLGAGDQIWLFVLAAALIALGAVLAYYLLRRASP